MQRISKWVVSLWLVLALGLAASAAGAVGKAVTRYHTIPGWDATPLGAFVVTPGPEQGNGPFPLIVMPASWALPGAEYIGIANRLAANGYIVVSYSSRGFWESGGQIDIAGPATVEDLSAVIDWALANTRADPARIGASGISYGAGVSLLAASRDSRIRAVAALSGWADLEASLYSGQTPSAHAMAVLVGSSYLTGRPGPELQAVAGQLAVGDFNGAVETVLPLVAQRNPQSGIDAINANGTAILLANAYNDSLFPPNQLLAFFNALQGPRQLRFAHGDHAFNELPGAVTGLPNEVYTGTVRWFDHHLKQMDNGVDTEAPIQLKTQAGAWHHYASWNAVQAGATVYGLDKPAGLFPTGQLGQRASTGWEYSIVTGIPTVANSGIGLVSGIVQGLVGLPPPVSVPLVARAAAGVWQGPLVWRPQRLTGAPRLRITVTPNRAETSLYAYLYAVDLLGNGVLLSHAPYSLRNAAVNAARTIELDMEATSWEIPAGRRLVLIVDTVDPRYAGVSHLGGAVRLSSPQARPSLLWVPLH